MKPLYRAALATHVLFLALVLPGWVSHALASTPSSSLLPVQGYLTDDQNVELTGVFQLNFSLFTQRDGGTALYDSTEAVSISHGRFANYLGDQTPLDLERIHAAPELWLEITIKQACGSDPSCRSGTPINKTLNPRIQLGASAYAVSATYCSNVSGTNNSAQSQTSATLADKSCDPNQFVVGVKDGELLCEAAPAATTTSSALPTVASCPQGQVLTGIQQGQGQCTPLPNASNTSSQNYLPSSGGTVNGDLSVTGTLDVGLTRRGCSQAKDGQGTPIETDCKCEQGEVAISGGAVALSGGHWYGTNIVSLPNPPAWRLYCVDHDQKPVACSYMWILCARLGT